MPSSEAVTIAVSRRDDALMFDGVLTRPVIASAWRQAQPLLSGTQRLDVTGVSRIDSAGLAMLAALAKQAKITVIAGEPAGYADLRAAYRLNESLACTAG